MTANRWNHPHLGLGLGLRSVHFQHVLEHQPPVDFFEIISENFMETEGYPLYVLDQVAERWPVIMHGVSLSIGSTDPLDRAYLEKLKRLARRIHPAAISDHLCWTGVNGRNSHDLLPLPYTEESLAHVARRVREVQDFLEAPLVLENASSYMEFTASTMRECDFLAALSRDADCGLLLDVNNVFVSAFNHGFDAAEYVRAIPAERIVYHHVAGHLDRGTYRLDTHDNFVLPEVWELYRLCEERTGGRSTLLEWDAHIPAFDVIHAEIQKAREYTPRVAADA